MSQPLISVQDIKKYFKVPAGDLKAVDGISFDIYQGETFGLVGESGCGKSTAGRTIMRLEEPTGGKLLFKGENIYETPKKEMQKVRKNFQMIFQDPYACLNPRMNVEEIVGEPLEIHGLYKNSKERRAKIVELLELVGLGTEHAMRFPHEFSGGQRQRIGIARALALEPEFIICDEPISALDVSIQAQVVNLLKDLQEDLGLTYLFIAHDLSMVKYISDRVGVMYLGRMMELASSDDLYANPLHPYTQALLSAIPIPDPKEQRKREIIPLEGDVPSPVDPPKGCRFVDRCPHAIEICRDTEPEWREMAKEHFVACHRVEELSQNM